MLVTLTFLAAAAITPAHHQQAAAALYQVLTSYNAYGLFQGKANEEGSVSMAEQSDGTLTVGSAFAVSPDGWLMTARHVVDPEGNLPDLCERLSEGWPGSVMLRHATMTILIEDIAGNTYGIVETIAPVSAGDNLCVPGTEYTVSFEPTTTAHIIATDSVADLALVKLDVTDIMYLRLASKLPHRWADLFVVGYTDPGERTVYSGAIARQCEETEGVCVTRSDGDTSCPMVAVMRTTAAVQEGMSGSPQVAGTNAVGVTTMKATDAPIGFAIPSPYALKWYRHIRWPEKHQRPTTVCVPTPEP